MKKNRLVLYKTVIDKTRKPSCSHNNGLGVVHRPQQNEPTNTYIVIIT